MRAHIGGIPVEEWVPFLIPVLALYFAGRRRNRRRAAAVNRLPDPSEGLDEDATTRVLARRPGRLTALELEERYCRYAAARMAQGVLFSSCN